MTTASALFVASGFAVNVWLGRLLGPEDYSRFGVVIALLTILNVVQNSAIAQAVARYVASHPREESGTLRTGAELQLAFGLLLALAVLLGAPAIAALMRDPELVGPLRLAALVLPPYGLFALLMAFYNGRQSYTRQAVMHGGYAVAKAFAAIGLAYLLQVVGAVGGYLVAPLAGILLGARRLTSARSSVTFRQLIGLAGPLSIFGLASVALMNVDIFFVKALAPDTAASGPYAASQNIARIPYFLLTGVSLLVLPALARALREGRAQATARARQSLRIALLAAVPASTMIAATARPLLELLYGASYAPGAEALSVLASAMAALALASITGSALSGIGGQRTTAAAAVIGLLLTLSLCVLLVPTLGGVGGAIATASGTGLAALVLAVALARALPGSLPLAAGARVVAVSAIPALTLWAANLAGAALLAGYAVAGAAILALLVLLGDVDREDLGRLLSAVRR
jgi:O-antigen/teichoic acid export membrane protein